MVSPVFNYSAPSDAAPAVRYPAVSPRQDGFAIRRTRINAIYRLHAGQLRRIAGKRRGRKALTARPR